MRINHCKKTVFSALLGLVVCLYVGRADAQINATAIQKIESGEIKEAKASWWGFDRDDSTKALQAAINAGAKRLVIENMGAPWIVTPIQIAGDLEIVFEEGVVVEAKKGAFQGGNE